MSTTAPKYLHLRTSTQGFSKVVACGRLAGWFAQSDDVTKVTCPRCLKKAAGVTVDGAPVGSVRAEIAEAVAFVRENVAHTTPEEEARSMDAGGPFPIGEGFDACLTNPAPRRLPDVCPGCATELDADGACQYGCPIDPTDEDEEAVGAGFVPPVVTYSTPTPEYSRQRSIDEARRRAHANAAAILDGTRYVIGTVAIEDNVETLLGDLIADAPAWVYRPALRSVLVDSYNTHLAIALVGIPRERAAAAAEVAR